MSTYLDIRNAANTVLIDDDYSNFGLALSGAGTLGRVDVRAENVCGAIDIYYQPPSTASMPVIAIRPVQNVPMVVGRMQVSNGVYHWRVHCSTYNVQVEYWIFNIPSQIPNSGGIFQTWNAQGVLVFDSNFKYLKIVDFINRSLNPEPPATGWSPVYYPAGRKYAFICLTYCNSFRTFTYERPPGNVWVTGIDWYDYGFWLDGATLNGAAYRYVGQISGPLGPPVGYYLSSNAGLMVVDVTGL